MKYYRADNAGRPVAGQQFHVTEIIAGTAVGVLSTDDKELIATLDALAKDPKSSVLEITAAEFEAAIKKNPQGLNPSKPLPVSGQAPRLGEALKGTGAVRVENNPVANPDEPVVELGAPLAKVDDALKVGSVKAPVEHKAEPHAPHATQAHAPAKPGHKK